MGQQAGGRPIPVCEFVSWKGRDATRLANGAMELVVLNGGGHLAEMKLMGTGYSSPNVLWEAPWVTRDPRSFSSQDRIPMDEPEEIRKFLAGFTGHALCLDLFGEPSLDEASWGLSLHGEASVTHWRVTTGNASQSAYCRWDVSLPVADLHFVRRIRLGNGESVAYIEEEVSNGRSHEHVCDWVQHVTFGAPLLCDGESTLEVSAERGITSALSYDGGSLLAADREFCWPYAPREATGSLADLRRPFSVDGQGLIAAVRLNSERRVEYLLAVNWKLRLAVGYCFRQDDFPWMTIWEENHARQGAPWNGRTQARGMEFGTTPLPLGRKETTHRGSLFGAPTGCVIPANGKKAARYLTFLAVIPPGVNAIHDVIVDRDAIALYDQKGSLALSVPAVGSGEHLSP